mmetsp:Transcript_43884/g.42408  ORF Transcript_43884/g.42408 Transcript_43884/m.42408 type:complete len:97 (+) Transcript_43884:1244-1534(+)
MYGVKVNKENKEILKSVTNGFYTAQRIIGYEHSKEPVNVNNLERKSLADSSQKVAKKVVSSSLPPLTSKTQIISGKSKKLVDLDISDIKEEEHERV